MKDCAPEKMFWLEDGRTLKNLRELEQALESMSTETYKHHVTKNQNDFANWIEHVVNDKTLAKLIRTARTRENTKNLVHKRIEELERPKTKILPKAAKIPKRIKGNKKPKKIAIPNPEYRSSPEPANHHIILAAHIALGIVVGSALTILVLMIT